MSSNNQYPNWHGHGQGWAQPADGLQVPEEDDQGHQGHYQPYYNNNESAPRAGDVADLTEAFQNTNIQEDLSNDHEAYGGQYPYNNDYYYQSTRAASVGVASTDDESQHQTYMPASQGYNQVPPSGNKKGERGPRNKQKVPTEKHKGNKTTSSSSKEQSSRSQQGQSAAIYGADDPFFAGPQIPAEACVEESQGDTEYHGYYQPSSEVQSDQQEAATHNTDYSHNPKPYNDHYQPPRQSKPSKRSKGKQREVPTWDESNSSTYASGAFENASDTREIPAQDDGYGTGFDDSQDDGYGTGQHSDISEASSATTHSDLYGDGEADDLGDGAKTPTGLNPAQTLQPPSLDYLNSQLGYHQGFSETSYPVDEDSMVGQGNPLDSRYVVENSNRFIPGEVFKTLWSEPLGASRKDDEKTTEVEVRESMGEKFYFGVRRFIVIANDEGNCTCVPILTYERRGCTKRGVKAGKHGIVYPSTGRPHAMPGEPALGFQPVRMRLDHATEKLAKESRINYAKLVTIEHNVKVFFIGRIVRNDFDAVQRAVEDCWAAKLHRAGDPSRKQGGGGGGNRRNRREG
ncbi:hypothetical protein OQA88_4933 [Cercophora sp. LCS_1]